MIIEGKFFVEYIEDGVEMVDTWSEECLLEEIRLHEVEITGIMPARTFED